MIVVAGSAMLRPDKREKAVAAAIKMVAATKQEAGCLQYDMFTDLNDPNRLFVFEVWESDAALMAHFQTPHMAEFAGVLPDVLAGAPDITRYEVASSAPLPVGE